MLWVVRAGKKGEMEQFALEKGVAVIGWDALPDLSGVKSRKELRKLLEKAYPDEKPGRYANWLGQIWAFVKEMKVGDLVALPLKSQPTVYFGRVAGEYRYEPKNPPGAKHLRPVKWLKELPREKIDQDILYSLGAFMTVCRVQRNKAEERVEKLLQGEISETPETVAEEERDLETIAMDQIRRYISQRFKGHDLTDLVAGVLSAQGYKIVQVAPKGPDGGIDILAGAGELGFDSPTIAVQVKSSEEPVDVKAIRELRGAMENFGADYGLFVSWGGFKRTVYNEVARQPFKIRLWNSDDLMREILRLYEHLPEDIQAKLPLKRIWISIPEEEA